jgi:hypothetical protein
MGIVVSISALKMMIIICSAFDWIVYVILHMLDSFHLIASFRVKGLGNDRYLSAAFEILITRRLH